VGKKAQMTSWQDTKKPHVVIIGGGFGGLYAAKALAKVPVRVTLIDKRNHHLFQPLLYQVATAALSPGDIAYPIRSVLRKQGNARVLLQEAKGIDVDAREVHIADGTLSYDYLIVATGATHSYFGHDEWAPHAPGLKTVEDALEIRRRILLAFEAAELEEDEARRRAWLTFVVVGAGPTGVELAGALSEIALHTVARDFRAVDPTEARVVLVEGAERVLPPYAASLSQKARQQLEKHGVEVRTGQRVSKIGEHAVWLGDEVIQARTTLWAAGVAGSPLARSLNTPLDPVGRVIVEPDLSVTNHPEVFVIGDLASVPHGEGRVPGVAPAAVQGGRHVASLIRGSVAGKSERPDFAYRDKGSLATIGRAAAVADLGRVKLSGFFAWLVWWAIHIFFLIGFRSRFVVMFGWIWSYLSFQRGARLITGSTKLEEESEEPAQVRSDQAS
jgi:NADH dehydrogenase